MGCFLSSYQREAALSGENTYLRHRIETLQTASNNDTELCRLFECKLCFDNLVSTVFLPCGHCMSCKECAVEFTKCPLCAVPIDDITYVTFP